MYAVYNCNVLRQNLCPDTNQQQTQNPKHSYDNQNSILFNMIINIQKKNQLKKKNQTLKIRNAQITLSRSISKVSSHKIKIKSFIFLSSLPMNKPSIHHSKSRTLRRSFGKHLQRLLRIPPNSTFSMLQPFPPHEHHHRLA